MEISIIALMGTFALSAMAFAYAMLSKAWNKIDRLTDKIMAERTPANFVTYASHTPTKGEPAEAKSFPIPTNGNGKHLVGNPNSVEALKEAYLKEHPHLEEI